ncbi:hypothetical protein [Aerosakkonema funiforme]|uniref:Uncharacterized protein n=1 Tax=Aerosakkonema funiforme FACHB-1375 TaxID=2949571 RepID=A0A926ZL37_9CYAN|nr:hypothetical protein [Aerosakkonema funiforme]MBD2186324.1 hypothetical protein [Aerosakkonema funiforme FACHB-1375]
MSARRDILSLLHQTLNFMLWTRSISTFSLRQSDFSARPTLPAVTNFTQSFPTLWQAGKLLKLCSLSWVFNNTTLLRANFLYSFCPMTFSFMEMSTPFCPIGQISLLQPLRIKNLAGQA